MSDSRTARHAKAASLIDRALRLLQMPAETRAALEAQRARHQAAARNPRLDDADRILPAYAPATYSWWLSLDRETFAAVAGAQAPRIASGRFAHGATAYGPGESRPRRRDDAQEREA
jgi:hypothetical protein